MGWQRPGKVFMTDLDQASDSVRLERLLAWTRRPRLVRALTIALVCAAVACGVATYWALSGRPPLLPDPELIRALLLIDLAVLLLLAALIIRRVVALWIARRRGFAGSKLHTRLAALFSIVAVAPAIIVAGFSFLFFDLGLQAWFSKQVQTAIQESVAVAEAYVKEHRSTIRADVLAMAIDLNRLAPQLQRSPTLIDQVLTTQADLRSLSEAVMFDSNGRIIGRSSLSFVIEFDKVPLAALERASGGEVVILSGGYDDRVRALVRLDRFLDAYLYIGRFVDAKVIAHVQRARRAADAYKKLEAERAQLEVTFALIYIVVSVLLLLAAVWLGLGIANRLAARVAGVVGAAEKVRDGDLTAVVEIAGDEDEIANLARTFNHMTRQLANQRAELVDANRLLDERRRFTETVLAGVTAGVIGLDAAGRIDLPNRSAIRLLDTTAAKLNDRPLAEAVPEMAALIAAARHRPHRVAQDEVTLNTATGSRTLLVRIAAERDADRIVGFVATFDDITDLLVAQRTAAWADIARRIAHEIKNPLTPIQLSAERLKRRYLGEITSDREVFTQCTDTIVRQVADIGRMVDEFSAFARMPAPVFDEADPVELARQAIFLQQAANGGIAYDLAAPDLSPALRCDAAQVSQALTNLLQNAAQAIAARPAPTAAPGRIQVEIDWQADGLDIVVSDNGVGLPRDSRARLIEPYVTNRAKGTGLGLAIVAKIMEEHGGQLILGDAPGGGATARLRFPILSETTTDADPPPQGKKVGVHGS